jgi:hypothetical protein
MIDDQFHYYHYLALVRALEESLRDLAWLYFSLLALPSAYSAYLLPTYFLPTPYLLPTYFWTVDGNFWTVDGNSAWPTSAYFWTVDGNSGLPTRESARMPGTLPGRVLPMFTDFYRCSRTFLGDFDLNFNFTTTWWCHNTDDDFNFTTSISTIWLVQICKIGIVTPNSSKIIWQDSQYYPKKVRKSESRKGVAVYFLVFLLVYE